MVEVKAANSKSWVINLVLKRGGRSRMVKQTKILNKPVLVNKG